MSLNHFNAAIFPLNWPSIFLYATSSYLTHKQRKLRIFSLVIFHAVCVLLNAHILMQFTQFSFIFLLLTNWHKIMFAACKFQNYYSLHTKLRSRENKRRETFLLNHLQLETEMKCLAFVIASNYQHVSSRKSSVNNRGGDAENYLKALIKLKV